MLKRVCFPLKQAATSHNSLMFPTQVESTNPIIPNGAKSIIQATTLEAISAIVSNNSFVY